MNWLAQFFERLSEGNLKFLDGIFILLMLGMFGSLRMCIDCNDEATKETELSNKVSESDSKDTEADSKALVVVRVWIRGKDKVNLKGELEFNNNTNELNELRKVAAGQWTVKLSNKMLPAPVKLTVKRPGILGDTLLGEMRAKYTGENLWLTDAEALVQLLPATTAKSYSLSDFRRDAPARFEELKLAELSVLVQRKIEFPRFS